VPKDHAANEANSKQKASQSHHNLLHPTVSFKMDENPEVVRHLVQTLGLIGAEGSELDALSGNNKAASHSNLDVATLDKDKSGSVISV